jgi:nitroimidazol reductase NimA-like FMN-containing flavoprotein (pyridoxamine 5'-phosphate oxidase superfamily)
MKMSGKDLQFLRGHELARFATASLDGMPHVTPVVYALDGGNPVIAVDYETRKLKNVQENPKAALVVDEYRPNRGIMIQGKCVIHERGREYLRLLKILFDKFESYRKNPWGEGESPIIVVVSEKSASWGI